MPKDHSQERILDAIEEPRLPPHTFPAPIVVQPLKQPHLHTLIVLHGRGSSARIFAPPFLSAPIRGPKSDIVTLREALPHARFVFPTAPRSRATVYRRSILNQWYDGSGDWEQTVLGHARETVEFVHALIKDQASHVGGAGRIFLGGFSQGCAAALLCLLLWEGDALGGVLGMCGMLPMSGAMEAVLNERFHATDGEHESMGQAETGDVVFEPGNGESHFGWESEIETTPLDQALGMVREEIGLPPNSPDSKPPFQKTPVFLGHGIEDDKVLLQYGQQAWRVLRMMECDVELKTYRNLGHWYSEEMLQDMLEFLESKGIGSRGVEGVEEMREQANRVELR